MPDMRGFLFFTILLIIIIGIIAIKFTYELWATSITIGLLKNNSGSLSGKRIIIWISVIVLIAIILSILAKKQQKGQQKGQQ
jgi:hypothetical protein